MQQGQRRLAAILAADVAGYSRLMAADEAGTLARLRSLRAEVIDPGIARFQGNVVGSAGDSLLIEFASAVNAVQCAVELQEALNQRNDELSEETRMRFRMGVNLGDVIAGDGTIHGDGVNVAARLEKLAEPGGVCLGHAIHDQVKGKLPYSFADLGEQRFHNIPNPVRAYRVTSPPSSAQRGREASDSERVGASRSRLASDKPSVAVLPFTNMSGDPEQDYLAAGMTEDIIIELSRFRQLAVVARQSTSRHQDKSSDAGQPGHESGVQFLVKGSVRRMADRFRISAQLIDASSGDHVWAEHFDRDQKDFFAVQDEVVRTIVATVFGRVRAVGAVLAGRKPPSNLAAYECVWHGKSLALGDPKSEAERRRWFEKAIEVDPGFGQAYAWLGHSLTIEWLEDMGDSNANLDRALELTMKAVALDPNDPDCINSLGWVHLFRQSFDLAEQYYKRALELNHNNAEQHGFMGNLYGFLGRPDEALNWYKRAREIDPFFEPSWYWHMIGIAQFVARRFSECLAALDHSPTRPIWVRAYMAACHAHLGQLDRAHELAEEIRRRKPEFSAARFMSKEPLRRPEDRQLLVEGFRKAGLPK